MNRHCFASTVAVGALACVYALPAQAQQPVRDGAAEQAVQDTISANLARRGYLAADPVTIATHAAIRTAIDDATASGGSSTGVAAANRTWAETIKGLLNDIASGFTWPLNIGKSGTEPSDFAGGGTFGGGGADGAWDFDCSAIRIEFDAQGYLIIPSFSADVGKVITYSSLSGPDNAFRVSDKEVAKTGTAAARWAIHSRTNAARAPIDWYGVIGLNGPNGLLLATVAYRRPDGVLVPRLTTTVNAVSMKVYNRGTHSGVTDMQCPLDAGASGADAHFYGNALGWTGDHNHSCTMFVPDPNQAEGEGGYFINKKTTIPFNGSSWPLQLPAGWKDCENDPTFVKRLADALFKKATQKVGYGGAPYAPIADEDARPNDLKVVDYTDNPTTGTRPEPNPTATPPPPATPPSSPPSPPSSGIDLGTDPNIGTPSDPEAPTNIMAPVFDWLPDLPSIQLNTAGAQCPTWEMQPFEGPEWHLVMDKHCPFIADNAALISTIMILGFTVGSAMIILRA